MPVRKPTLEEWFLMHQLHHVQQNHFHLPFTLDIDVSETHFNYVREGQTPNWTAILIRAAAKLLEIHPAANRVVFRTVFGDRILEPDYIAVNLPVMLQGKTSRHLNAAIIRDAHRKSIDEIKNEIKSSCARDPERTLMGPFVYGRPNHFLNRLKLRGIHFYASNFPAAYEKFGGGGISVSSLMNKHDGLSGLRIQAYGQTGYTLGLSSVVVESNRATMHLGVAYDHFAFSGEESAFYGHTLARILREGLVPDHRSPKTSTAKPEQDHRPSL